MVPVMAPRPDRDPLAPIEFVVKVLLTFLLVLFAIFGTAAVWQLVTGGDTSFGVGAFSEGDVCLSDVRDVPVLGLGNDRIAGLDEGAGSFVASTWFVCADDPAAGVRVAAAADLATGMAGLLGSMALLLWAVRGARRVGLFSSTAVRRTRILGWFFLLSAVVGPTVTALLHGLVLADLVDDYPWWRPLGSVSFGADFSALAIVVGIGIITFARVLERAVPLQEEVDATV